MDQKHTNKTRLSLEPALQPTTSSSLDTVSISTTTERQAMSLDSISLYNISNLLWKACPPVILLFGIFGNVTTLVIMSKITSSQKDFFPLYLTSIAIADLSVLFSMVLLVWVNITFHSMVLELLSMVCKVFIWLQTGSGTAGCWYIVLLSLHRAVSVVWPHRVNLLCTRRLVVVLLSVITVFLAGLCFHFLYGYELPDPSVGTSHRCMMKDEVYIHFVVDVFKYVELVIYCLLLFVCLVLANGVLVWKLTTSVRQARHSLTKGTSEQAMTREKATQPVTLTVTVVSLTLLLLTLSLYVYYVLFYVSKEHNKARGHEYAKLYFFCTVIYILNFGNCAVNLYLYCLTERTSRVEFLNVMVCWKQGKRRRLRIRLVSLDSVVPVRNEKTF